MRNIFRLLVILSAAAVPAAPGRRIAPKPQPLTESVVNDAKSARTLLDGDAGPAALRAQILLDREGLSVGEIDGRIGKNTFRAISGLRAQRGWAESAMIDEPIWGVLNGDTAPALTRYRIALEDVKGPFTKVPGNMLAKARLPHLGFASALEALGEKFHSSPALLRALNPRSRFTKAGEELIVPNVRPRARLQVAKIEVYKELSVLRVLDDQGKIVLQYPCTSGSEHDPLPIGVWNVTGIYRNPHFNYDPDLFWDANPKSPKARIAPGPNNPVGVVWIDLSKEHYGIHGTPEPSKIGYAESHGCIRLTNWDAAELADLVVKGTPVELKE